MAAQRQNHPTAEMFIKSYQNTIFRNCLIKYLPIIRTILTGFGRAEDVVAVVAQSVCHR